jgi:hypothetical protein
VPEPESLTHQHQPCPKWHQVIHYKLLWAKRSQSLIKGKCHQQVDTGLLKQSLLLVRANQRFRL